MNESPKTAIPVQRLASFTAGDTGGNPAGVVISDTFPGEAEMLAIAAGVGFSETAFAVPDGADARGKANNGNTTWRVRYFAPEQEVDFCGHATIALGAALGRQFGTGQYTLNLNAAGISVTANDDGSATLVSPPATSRMLDAGIRAQIMESFGLNESDIDPVLGSAMVNAGNDHVLLGLASRARLAAMDYDFDAMRVLMRAQNIATIALAVRDKNRGILHVRNAFAFGGVVEDPATGAAAAAIAGYLRDNALVDMTRGKAEIILHQGDDMGTPCRLYALIRAEAGAGIALRGFVRDLPFRLQTS